MLAISLFWLGVILVISATLMLFWDAFKLRKLWAIVSLVLIVPLIVHLFLNWSTLAVRKAFYILVIGILSIAVSIFGGALSQLTFLPESEVVQVLEENIAPPKEEPLPNQEQADAAALSVEKDYDPLLTGSEYEALETEEILSGDVQKTIPNPTPAPSYQPVTVEERVHAINKQIRMTMVDGEVVEGTLTNVLDDSVLIESSVSGGSLGLSYSNDQIISMAVRLEAGEQLIKPETETQTVNAEAELPEEELSTETQALETQSIEVVQPGAPDAVLRVQEQVTAPEDNTNQAIVEEITPKAEVVRPEMKAIEPVSDEIATKETLEEVQEIVDDSKSFDGPIDQ